jgi:thiamine pyrophosphate-dependent acetolactate synthase large subunit-like protein
VQIFRAVCKKSWEISVNFVVLSLVSPALYHAKSEKARAASVKLQKDAGKKEFSENTRKEMLLQGENFQKESFL